ncbi:MAG: peroxide stress protein YaaA [Propionibacteriaceae bacterium]|nr:peroxide stress protein YaaA [Propionibacteriaceae bacterium]
MLLVLPPSRGQSPGAAGSPGLDLAALSLPELTAARRRLLAALAGSPHDPAGQPTAPAAEVFTGVLYAAAGLPGLLRRPAIADRVRRDVLIALPLLGLVGAADPIPASRLAPGPIPGVGGLGAFWRAELACLDARVAGELVVDLRSAEFMQLWRPPATADWVSVRVEQEVDGVRRVVSHHAKHLRGVLVHHLLTSRGAVPTDAAALLRTARTLARSGRIRAAELAPPARPGTPGRLTLVQD